MSCHLQLVDQSSTISWVEGGLVQALFRSPGEGQRRTICRKISKSSQVQTMLPCMQLPLPQTVEDFIERVQNVACAQTKNQNRYRHAVYSPLVARCHCAPRPSSHPLAVLSDTSAFKVTSAPAKCTHSFCSSICETTRAHFFKIPTNNQGIHPFVQNTYFSNGGILRLSQGRRVGMYARNSYRYWE